MTDAAARMLVLAGKEFACVKVIGRANFSSAIDFKTLLDELRQKGYSCFVLDLSECALMDSTFLGVLAGLGLKMSGGHPSGNGAGIELLNPNVRIIELLETLGVLHLFKVTQGTAKAPEGVEPREHCSVPVGKEEAKRACLEAHETLMQIHPENVPKFKDLAQFLAEDLKKIKSAPGK